MALDALIGYGVEGFLESFYKVMGTAYLKPHEAGLRSLFKTIAVEVGPAVSANREMRKLWRKVVSEEAAAAHRAGDVR